MAQELYTNCKALFSRGEHSGSQKRQRTCSTKKRTALASRRILDATPIPWARVFHLKLWASRRAYLTNAKLTAVLTNTKEVP